MYIHIELVQPVEFFEVKKLFFILTANITFIHDETKKALSHLSDVPVKICMPSTSAAYSEMCPIKGSTRMKLALFRRASRRRRLQFEYL